jgi:pilus assembly protein CpaC
MTLRINRDLRSHRRSIWQSWKVPFLTFSGLACSAGMSWGQGSPNLPSPVVLPSMTQTTVAVPASATVPTSSTTGSTTPVLPLMPRTVPASTAATPAVLPTLQNGTANPTAARAPQAAPPAGTAPAASAAKEAAPAPLPPVSPIMGQLKNPLLSPTPGQVGSTPVATQATQAKIEKYIQKVVDPETTLDLVAGQTRVIVLKNTPLRIQTGDDRYLAVNIINPKEILVHGKEVGSTVLNIWFGDANDPTKQETISYMVKIYPDPEAKERLERAYKKLEDDINKYFKDSSVRLKLVGDRLVVSGRVRDAVQGAQILRIIRSNTNENSDQRSGTASPSSIPDASTVPLAGANGLEQAVSLDNFRASGGPSIINMLEVAGEQQVQLRVIVAEVNRAAARSIGMNFSLRSSAGITVFSNNTGGLNGFGGGAGAGGQGGNGGNGGFTNINFQLDGGKIPLAIDALKTLSYAKSLAEPTLQAMNGHTANFLAGGQFPVPVISTGVGVGFGGIQGVQYIPYGVQLSFTPYITDRDRIRLQLNAAVTSRDVATGTNIGGGQVAGLNSRTVNTTVELRQGETLAVAGLIESNLGADSTRIPFLGDLPYIGQLTGVNRVSAGEKELIIFITPELARPLDADQRPPLPGSDILDPSDLEFYILNRLEGHVKDYRSPIRTDLSRIKQYQLLERTYVSGLSGYTEPPVSGVRP